MRTIKLRSVRFDLLVEACCHKQNSLMRGFVVTVCAINGCRRRSAINYSTVQTVDDTRHSTSRRPEISQILVENRDFCPSYGVPSEYCHAIWNGKLKWCSYPMVNKIFKWRGGLVVGRRTCDLVVAGSRPGRDAAV